MAEVFIGELLYRRANQCGWAHMGKVRTGARQVTVAVAALAGVGKMQCERLVKNKRIGRGAVASDHREREKGQPLKESPRAEK